MTMTVGQAFEQLFGPDSPMRLEAYDGSSGGRPDGAIVRLKSPRGLNYLVTSPGSLGMARAYLMGDLEFEGMNESDPYEQLKFIEDGVAMRRPALRDLPELTRLVRRSGLRLPELPPEETPGPLHRLAAGIAHARGRDAQAIQHHYDVSNAFYELLLGPAMTYTCAVYPTAECNLEQAQANKYDLICRKLGLQRGMRLLDVGCGWGGMVRYAVKHYGVTALGVTLSQAQADWGAAKVREEGLEERAEIRHSDYRDVTECGFDAVSSIGLTEHIGVRNYPSYFTFLRDRLRDGGRLLNHCITRPDNQHPGVPSRGFINRYVFPDGGLTGSGDIVRVMEDQGLEVRHHENLREHYAMTCRDWSANLSKTWEAAVDEVGLGTARVWGLYIAGSRLSFELNRIQLHQVLATRTGPDGDAYVPLRPDWGV